MKAIVYPEPNVFELTEVQEPKPGPGQALVRVRASTLCATDFKIFRGQFPGTRFPHTPGHEWAGEVVEVGTGVTRVKPGDRVGVEIHVGCGACRNCLEGRYNICLNYGNTAAGHAHIGFTVPGGMAELCAVPEKALHVLPDELDFDEGAFTDSIGVALYALERGRLRAGDGVVIIGPGAMGLIALQLARHLGAGRLTLIGTRHDRLELAGKLGADVDHLVNVRDHEDVVAHVKSLYDGLGPDLVVEFAGSEEAARQALEMACRGGRVVLGGATGPGRTLHVDLSVIVRGNLDVLGSLANPGGVSRRGLAMMARGLVRVKPLVTHHMPLEQFGEAWETFAQRRDGAIRVMLQP